MIGQTLAGQYEIVRQLGSGGMGAVYEARSISQERVAIKVISTGDIAKDKALVGRFHREAKAATGIDTDHIVRVLATGTDETNDQPFMVMEFLVGEDLHHLFHRLGPLPPDVALRIIGQACIGLGKAHEAHVVHRDIKPANIYLHDRGDGERIVKLLDFGIAKIKMDKANSNDTTGLTRTGSMLGSPLYMSPEQARGSKSIDHRADIWSLGIVFYQALTGKTPNQEIEALGELIIAICSEPPRPVQEVAPWVSPEIAQIVHKTLRFDPAERYQTAQEMFDAIRAVLPGGVAIYESMLLPMTAEQKAVVAQRADIPAPTPLARSGSGRTSMLPPEGPTRVEITTGSGGVRADGGTNAGLAQTPSTARPSVRSSASRLPLLLGGTAIVGAGLAYVLYARLYVPRPPDAIAAVAPPTAEVASPAATRDPLPTVAPEPPMQLVKLQVIPADAAVEVDGVRVVPEDGRVVVRGILGSTHPVRVWRGPTERVTNVAITDSGALPAKVDLEINGRQAAPPRPQPAAPGRTTAPAPGGPTQPAPVATFKDKFE